MLLPVVVDGSSVVLGTSALVLGTGTGELVLGTSVRVVGAFVFGALVLSKSVVPSVVWVDSKDGIDVLVAVLL